ncbi:d-xylulose 5-phosphate d-fructose 6-phosphate [Colletotrichum sojae]|uniref:D-xylulose 5-phosphate d-fructose 6-phosphate n=1 Tax=Colletotrichum sojae TaxID=2175907 RepID=A0A8H6JFM9_9PEZI|nr:d-xylulose 5-phosphate d-fructose 6-phosphate [Colletotrichum sojae]
MCLVTGNVSFGGLYPDRHKESTFHHIVDRWITYPILILVWSHLNLLIRKRNQDMMFAIGPGYGMPATLAALWLDGSLQKLLPEMTHSPEGLSNLVTNFSAPDGLSYTTFERDEVPIGHTLRASRDAVEDNPSLIVPFIISSRGPSMVRDWNIMESIDPKTSGAVIPIVHCDGLKDVISDDWLADLATKGFQVCKIQRAARSDEPTINSPRWPIIALHVPVGHTYPKDMHGAIFQSQQLPFARDSTFQGHLDTLETWRQKYKISSLLAGGKPNARIVEAIPEDDAKKLRLLTAKNPYADSSLISQPKLNRLCSPPGVLADQAEKMLELFDQMKRKSGRFRILSSSLESTEKSKKLLVAVLDYEKRDFQWDDYSGDKRRRPIYLHDAMVEYARFTNAAKQTRWRWERASMNFIEMHPLADEGLTLIQKVLDVKGAVTGVYFPPDANCFHSIVEHCMKSTNKINLVIGAKQPIAAYFDKGGADHTTRRAGLYTWLLYPTYCDDDPDVVLGGIGVEMMFGVAKAAELLQGLAPELKIRVVNVVDLTAVCPKGKHPRALSDWTFETYFTATKHLSFSYPGKAEDLHDFKENLLGTPFGHMLLNSVSRFDVAIQALRAGTELTSTRLKKRSLRGNIKEVEKRRREVNDYIDKHGKGV